MSTSIPSLGQLHRAVKIAEEIQALQAELAVAMGRSQPPGKASAAAKEAPPAATGKKRKKHVFSPEARAKIAAAQKARWAKQKEKAAAPAKKGKK